MVLVLLCHEPLQAQSNLAQDPSFEAGLRPWFNENGGTKYFIEVLKVPDAKSGSFVLGVEGWDKAGSTILAGSGAGSGLIPLATGAYSATIAARCIGTNPTNVELALFNDAGTTKLVTLFKQLVTPGAGWSTLSGVNVPLVTSATSGKLAIIVSGTQANTRVELDCVGLFAGSTLGPVIDNAELFTWQASTLADGAGWLAASASGGGSYYDVPISSQVLSGAGSLPAGNPGEVIATATVAQGGMYRAWVHFLHTGTSWPAQFTIHLRQNGATLATKTISCEDAVAYGTSAQLWAWDSISANLAPGTAEVVLHRPVGSVAWFARRIDFLILTNLTDYVPIAQDFRPSGYVRFTNHSAVPFCLWLYVRRHLGPEWYHNLGMLSHAGLSRGYSVPGDHAKWLGPGETSPWVRVSDDLLPNGNRNNFQMIATQSTHTAGFAPGTIIGDLEFATGDDRTNIHTIHVNQAAPRVLFTVPHDFLNQSDEILSAWDYIDASQSELSTVPIPTLATKIEVYGLLALTESDDPLLRENEMSLIRHLGMNNVYRPVVAPASAKAFNLANGLLPTFGWSQGALVTNTADPVQGNPNTTAIATKAQSDSVKLAPILNAINHLKLADEPRADSYAKIVASPISKTLFKQQLQAEGHTLAELGVGSWSQVVPTDSAGMATHPALYYHTGLYRLKTFGSFAKTANSIVHQYYPATALGYINIPPTAADTWVGHGQDPFYMFRDGGLDLIWTEDWPGYGISVQQLSDHLGMLNAAGQGVKRYSSGPSVVKKRFGTGSMEVKATPPISGTVISTSTAPYSQLNHLITQMTLTCWVNPLAGSDMTLVSRSTSGHAGYFKLQITSQKLRFTARSAAGASSPVNSAAIPGWSTNSGTWTHLAMTFNAGVITFYVNGIQSGSPVNLVLSGTSTAIPSIPSVTDGPPPIRLFESTPVGNHGDDFGYFGGVALNAAQIASIYNNGLQNYVATSPPAIGPNAYYYFDDANTAAATDSSGNGFLAAYNGIAGMELGGYSVPNAAPSPEVERINVYIWLAAGARKLNFYNYGPYYASVDSWSTRFDLFPTMAALGGEIGALDSSLPGLAPRAAKIAILYNRTAGIWDNFASNTEQDSRYIYWALAHGGYAVDFIPEEDVEAGGLSKYKVLYLNGVQLRTQTATAISSWVNTGGYLVGTAGAGSRNEFNNALATLNPVFGATSSNLLQSNDAGRPKYETRTLPILDVLTSTSSYPYPALSLNRLGMRETLSLTSGTAILQSPMAGVAGAIHGYGTGKAVRLAVLPGLTYINDAVRSSSYDIDSFMPQNYRAEVAQLIAWPAVLAAIKQVNQPTPSAPLATVTRWDSGTTTAPGRSVLFVIDYSGVPKPGYSVTIPDAQHFTSVRSARGTAVTLTHLPGNMTRVTFPLDVTDALILE